MRSLGTYLRYRRLTRSQWLDGAGLQALQTRKLRRLVDHAYRTVPFQRARFDAAGLRPDDVRVPSDLLALPPVTKDALRAAGSAAMSTAFGPDELYPERTSGSTGEPFVVQRDAAFVQHRKAQLVRALRTAGYRFGDRLLALTSRARSPAPSWLRWRYVSIEKPVAELLAEHNAFRPAILMSYTTTLRQLAACAAASVRPFHRPRVVINSAEMLDDESRRLIADAFKAPVFDTYAMTEMGIVACQCPVHGGYHMSEDSIIVDLEPGPDPALAELVVTNLDLLAMPFIRYAPGDLVGLGAGHDCPCGRGLLHVSHVEGRRVDSIRLAGGEEIAPFRVTSALEKLPGIDRYQVIQEDFGVFTVRLAPELHDGAVADAARRSLREIIGDGARIDVRWEADLDPPRRTKFRPIVSRVGGKQASAPGEPELVAGQG